MMTPAGWYPDPTGAGGQRYWDGNQWTGHAAPASAQYKPGKTPMTKSAKIAVSVAVVLVVAVLGLTSFGKSTVEESVAQENAGTVGSVVTDGKFSFVVSSVERQTNWYGEPKPRGEWVIATVQVTNIGNEPQSFFVSNQKLIDTAGREYAADGTAAIYMDQESMALDLGPGLSLTVKVPFDVPRGATLAALQLHDSAFSGGVKVSV